jgi:hypothetical protein
LLKKHFYNIKIFCRQAAGPPTSRRQAAGPPTSRRQAAGSPTSRRQAARPLGRQLHTSGVSTTIKIFDIHHIIRVLKVYKAIYPMQKVLFGFKKKEYFQNACIYNKIKLSLK